ncbi:MAG: hypothetical protein ACPL6D_13560 [Thermodesulfobacteriota bacterium]
MPLNLYGALLECFSGITNLCFWENIFIAGENLTNVHYEYLKGYPMLGITVMGE